MANGAPMLVNYQGRLTPVEELPDEELIRIAQASGGVIPGAQPPAPAPLTGPETQQALAGIRPGATVPTPAPLTPEETRQALAGIVPGARPPAQPAPLTAAETAQALRGVRPGAMPPTPAPLTSEETERILREAQPGPAVADGNGGGSGPAAQLQRLILGATPTAAPDFSIIGSRFPARAEVGPPGAEEAARRGITTESVMRGGQWVPVSRTGPSGEALPVSEGSATLTPIRSEAERPAAPTRWETTGKVAAPAAPVAPAQPPGRQAGIAPDTERLAQEGFAAQRRAIEEAATVGARVEAARAASTAIQAEEARRAQAEQAELAQAQRQAGEKAEQDYRLAVEELKTPSGAINPARWWQQSDTGTKIAAGLAAFLSGLAGTRNPVEAIIERDIAAQKDALDRLGESRRAQVQAKLSLLGAMRARFGDEQAALAATRAAAYGAAEAEARQMEAKATQGAAKAKAGEVVGQLQAKQAEAITELRMRQAQTAGLRAEAAIARAKVAALGQPGGLTPEEQKRVVATPYGTTLALNLEEAKKLNNATRAFYNLSQAADRLIQLREEYGQETLPGPIKDEMQANRNAVLLHYKNMMELGAAFTESEQKMVEAVTGGDPTRIAPGVLAGLKRFRDSVGREYTNMYRVATGREPFAGGVQPGGQ